MKKEMLINVLQPEECRIAIVEDGVLEELYVERTSHESYTGNIYKGRIVNLEPAIQASFVDFSVGRNGFLHISDVEPQYYRKHLSDDDELGARDRGREPRRDLDGSEHAPRRERPESRGRERDRERPERDRSDRERVEHDKPERDKPEHDKPERDKPERDKPERDKPERERPDRSEKGRRDRSGRRFGEGLVEGAEDWSPPPVAETPPPASEPPVSSEVSEPWPTVAAEPTLVREEGPGAAARPDDRDEPRAQFPRAAESYDFEADLPPSRTQRGRPSRPIRPASFGELDDTLSLRPAVSEHGPGAEPSSEARIPEPRRGRGRGKPDRPGETPELFVGESEPGAAEAPGETEPAPVDRPEHGRRRGGRSAIRSRGGARELLPERRERPPLDDESDRPRRERPRGAEKAAESELPRERSRLHGRAGEPGYVPRRERVRGAEPGEAEAPPHTWPEAEGEAAEPPREPTLDELSELLSGEVTPAGRPEAPRRRRRRRGRRREREPREAEGAVPSAEEESGPDQGLLEERPRRRERPTGLGPHRDDLDFEEEPEDEEEEPAEGRLPVEPEDEIDPGLEEEIRREIEEITELEREMGLRGPSEARPRRGDERELVEPGRPGRPARGRGLAKPPIQEVFRRGDEVLVQVIKESIGTKGPTLSTYISIPGRYLVLMPGLNRVGVSRKIADEAQRRKLREIMNELNPPKGLGFIVRTAGLDRTKRELARDLAYLLRLWKVILRRIKKAKTPAPIYQESDMITRTIRDIFSAEIDTIWVDEPAAFERAQEFLRVVMPRYVDRLKLYDSKVPLFHKYGIEEEIAKIQRRHVPLPEGGSIVIDQTEAMVAIDVNSGNFRVEDDAERTAYEMNLRAAKEIARQLRLRDLGGVIVNDFIDMREERNRRGVERALREAVRRDRARTKVLRMSQFGLIEMTRQRIRPSLKRSVYEDCPHCTGAGVVKTVESMSIDVMRLLALASHREEVRRINISVSAAVAAHLNNRKRKEIARIENDANMTIHIRHEEGVPGEHLQFDCFDSQNSEVRLLPAPPPPHRRSSSGRS
jgi:ribonuclease E